MGCTRGNLCYTGRTAADHDLEGVSYGYPSIPAPHSFLPDLCGEALGFSIPDRQFEELPAGVIVAASARQIVDEMQGEAVAGRGAFR